MTIVGPSCRSAERETIPSDDPTAEHDQLTKSSREVKSRNLTYLPFHNLRVIERCIAEVVDDGVPGIFLEAGVALGGSAIAIASRMPEEREFHGYDVFGMFPPPGARDGAARQDRYREIASGLANGIGGDRYYAYEGDLFQKVAAAFASFGLAVDGCRVVLHQGLFEETLELRGVQVAFAHIDCGWYDSMKLCLERIYEAMSPGGFIVCDDYYGFEGAALAVDEFLMANPDVGRIEPERPPRSDSNLVLRRRAGP
ncbi:MAG: TylF/MycF/NovP-related O-methyltransferase [Acidobacteriota bacterium]